MDKTVKGKVTKIEKYGAFVTVSDGRKGMIHISELSSSFVKNVGDFVKVGDEIEAAVLKEDENGRLALSLKKLAPISGNTSLPPENFEISKENHASSFEDMMSKFKSISEDKMSDLKKSRDGARYERKNRR